MDHDSYFWIATRAWVCTCAEGGERKEEVAVPTEAAAQSPPQGRLTFASVVWLIAGVEVPNPTPAQLRSLDGSRGDGLYLKHGRAKNDFFGNFFAATPSFHPFDAFAPRNAARAIRDMELAAQPTAPQRALWPLFGPEPGVAFTYGQVTNAFELMLLHGANVPPDALAHYSVHSFRIFAACALLAANVPRAIIKRMLRWRGDESLEIYARVNDTEWRRHVFSTYTTEVSSTIADRLAGLGVVDLEAAAARLAQDLT